MKNLVCIGLGLIFVLKVCFLVSCGDNHPSDPPIFPDKPPPTLEWRKELSGVLGALGIFSLPEDDFVYLLPISGQVDDFEGYKSIMLHYRKEKVVKVYSANRLGDEPTWEETDAFILNLKGVYGVERLYIDEWGAPVYQFKQIGFFIDKGNIDYIDNDRELLDLVYEGDYTLGDIISSLKAEFYFKNYIYSSNLTDLEFDKMAESLGFSTSDKDGYYGYSYQYEFPQRVVFRSWFVSQLVEKGIEFSRATAFVDRLIGEKVSVFTNGKYILEQFTRYIGDYMVDAGHQYCDVSSESDESISERYTVYGADRNSGCEPIINYIPLSPSDISSFECHLKTELPSFFYDSYPSVVEAFYVDESIYPVLTNKFSYTSIDSVKFVSNNKIGQ